MWNTEVFGLVYANFTNPDGLIPSLTSIISQRCFSGNEVIQVGCKKTSIIKKNHSLLLKKVLGCKQINYLSVLFNSGSIQNLRIVLKI